MRGESYEMRGVVVAVAIVMGDVSCSCCNDETNNNIISALSCKFLLLGSASLCSVFDYKENLLL